MDAEDDGNPCLPSCPASLGKTLKITCGLIVAWTHLSANDTKTFFATRPCPWRNVCIFWQNCYSCCMFRRWPQRFTKPIWTLWIFIFGGCFDLALASPAKQIYGTKFSMTGMLGWQDMFRRLAFWNGRSGAYNNTGICALVYLTLDGYQKFGFGDPGLFENVELHSGFRIPPQKPSAVENRCYEYTTLVRIYFRVLLLHLRELRWPMLDSDCTNACAWKGFPAPMRHWFTGFIR